MDAGNAGLCTRHAVQGRGSGDGQVTASLAAPCADLSSAALRWQNADPPAGFAFIGAANSNMATRCLPFLSPCLQPRPAPLSAHSPVGQQPSAQPGRHTPRCERSSKKGPFWPSGGSTSTCFTMASVRLLSVNCSMSAGGRGAGGRSQSNRPAQHAGGTCGRWSGSCARLLAASSAAAGNRRNCGSKPGIGSMHVPPASNTAGDAP